MFVHMVLEMNQLWQEDCLSPCRIALLYIVL